jgi:hypothetical protein
MEVYQVDQITTTPGPMLSYYTPVSGKSHKPRSFLWCGSLYKETSLLEAGHKAYIPTTFRKCDSSSKTSSSSPKTSPQYSLISL